MWGKRLLSYESLLNNQNHKRKPLCHQTYWTPTLYPFFSFSFLNRPAILQRRATSNNSLRGIQEVNLTVNLSVLSSVRPSITHDLPALPLSLSVPCLPARSLSLQGQWVCPQRGLYRKRGVEGCGMLTSVFDHYGGYNPFYSTWSTLYWPRGPTPSGETTASGAQWRCTGKVFVGILCLSQLFPPRLIIPLFLGNSMLKLLQMLWNHTSLFNRSYYQTPYLIVIMI